MLKQVFFLLFIGFSILFSGCNDVQKKIIEDQQAQSLLSESVIANSIYNATKQESTIAGLKAENQLKSAQTSRATSYPQYVVEPADLGSWPKTITVNFGPNNIEGTGEHTYRGKMLITAQQFPHTDGASWRIEFDNFFIDDYQVEGIQTIRYNGTKENGHPWYQTSVKNGKITSPDNRAFFYSQILTYEQTEGYNTPAILGGDNLCDDSYSISGNQEGISSDGYNYSISTTENLIVRPCCKWAEAGILNVQLTDYDLTCSINFKPSSDEGGCNNIAAFTIFGTILPVTLP